jgi:hypothetical protein
MIKQYKPNDSARIEAMLFTQDKAYSAGQWAGRNVRKVELEIGRHLYSTYEVQTLEGWVDLPFGHYLAKGVNNEFYPIDPDVFAERWVEIGDEG